MNHSFNPSETAADCYADLLGAVAQRPDYGRVYQLMGQTFKRLLNQKTAETQINFGGDFAKTDFLLKEYRADGALRKAVNDSRVRLRQRYGLKDEEMQRFCLHDFRNLCRFVALVCRTDIPEALTRLFPTEAVPSFTPLLAGDSLRVIVERWDEQRLYVHTELADDVLQTVEWTGEEWDYLKRMLARGVQLNLIRPRQEDGVLYPELIIYEPDYLVNISTVAHCFTNYADSPFVELIKKLEAAKTTEAIVLGNLAGQLLDEAIHQLPEGHSYADSVGDFFHDHAVSLLTTTVGSQFHQEAQRQRRHIRRAMQELLPQALSHFDIREGIVEPSFFCEMLGLQGRMDYLQMDLKVLLEQKSGKGGYPYDNFVKPRFTDEHYVQMLLYMAVIRYGFRKTYERNGRQLHAFLLYSKYEESLLGLGFAPELLAKAVRVRNGLAWLEMQLAKPDGYRLLERLTPEQLNRKHATNTLWNNYQRPQIAAVLDTIRQATPLERDYCLRFLTFIANEHLLSKIGNKTKESSGFAATWHDTLDEKRQAGNIYDRLTLLSPDAQTAGRITTVVLRFAETADNDLSNFRVGDIVILYAYDDGREPDLRQTIVLRCTIVDIGTDTIRLMLRAPQADSRFFLNQSGRLWAIEHDFMEAGFASQYRGMMAFLSAPQERRDLLLLQREPQTDPTQTLKGHYGDFDALALRVKQARDLFLIIGPPGTGKTSYGMLNTVKEELLEPDGTVLLLSYTNRAVDEICSKLMAEGIDFIRIGGEHSCAAAYRDKLLNSRVGQCGSVAALRKVLLTTRVVAGTTTALTSNIQLLRLKQFSLAVIDEASQILEPHLTGLLGAAVDGVPAIRKMVLIGDYKQLPAVVQQTQEVSRVTEEDLQAIGLTDCRLSLFERLLKRYAKDAAVCYMLRRQGRMHRDIARFPNEAFYHGELIEVPLPHQHADLPTVGHGSNGIIDLLRTRRIAFIETEVPEESPSDKVNQVEADMIAATVVKIYEIERADFQVDHTVGVIVPYRNQIATVRKAIDRYGIAPLHDITIDTVERYQGSQRRYIVYGFTVQKPYQLSFLTDNVFEDAIDGCIVDRKLNVAMTRAEEHLLMMGNAQLLRRNNIFSRLLDFVSSRQGYFKISRDDYVAGRFSV